MGEKSAFRVTKWLLPTDSFHNRFKAPQKFSLWSHWDVNVAASNFSCTVFPPSCSCHWTCREMLAVFGDKHLCCLQLFWLKGMTELNSLWSQQDSYKVEETQNLFCEFWCDYFSHALTGGALEQGSSLLQALGGMVPGTGCCLWVALLSLACTEILLRKEGNIPLSP